VFPYFQSTLLALIQGNPKFPTEGRKNILRQVGEAIQELHNRDWIHLGIIPYSECYCMDMLGADLHIQQTSNLTTCWSTAIPTEKGTRQSSMQLWATSI
jgi:hypothetical protein